MLAAPWPQVVLNSHPSAPRMQWIMEVSELRTNEGVVVFILLKNGWKFKMVCSSFFFSYCFCILVGMEIKQCSIDIQSSKHLTASVHQPYACPWWVKRTEYDQCHCGVVAPMSYTYRMWCSQPLFASLVPKGCGPCRPAVPGLPSTFEKYKLLRLSSGEAQHWVLTSL